MIYITVSGNVTIARGLLFVPHAPNASNWKDTSKYPKSARALTIHRTPKTQATKKHTHRQVKQS